MAARAGMTALILRLRGMTETGATDYTVNSAQWWTDDQLQDILDQHVTRIEQLALSPIPEVAAGATVFKDYPIGYGNLEDNTSDAGHFFLSDSTGTEVADGGYTGDWVGGVLRFTADTTGVVYYLKARSYNLNLAAAAVWRMKMSHAASGYDFTTEGQSFSRSQMFEHARAMAEHYSRQGGTQTVELFRSDLW